MRNRYLAAAAVLAVGSVASTGLSATLASENFEGQPAYMQYQLGTTIPAAAGNVTVSNPAFSPDDTTGQGFVEIFAFPDANNAFTSQSADLNVYALNIPFTLTAAEPSLSLGFDYGLDANATADQSRAAVFQFLDSAGGVVANPGVVTTGSVTPGTTASFAAGYNLGAGSYTLQLSSDSAANLRGTAVDNIVLSSAAVPEPASLGLLGLGGIALLRRRRA